MKINRQLRVRVPSFCLAAGFLLVAGQRTAAQEPSAAAAPAAASRACTSNPMLAPGGKHKHASKTKHPLPPEPLPACLEVKGEALEVQETLQAIARDLQWRIHDNHATDDTWTFVRYLSPEELEKYAETKVLIEPVVFEHGKAAVVVRTVDLGAGYVRVQISAHFEGEGKSTDATIKQPATSWPLNSKGGLEKDMIQALQARYQHVE
jgi:hypothetical protein